jgi:hypothetical protein
MIDLFHERINKAQADLPEGMIVLFTSSDDIASHPDVQQIIRNQVEFSQ